MSAHVLPVLSSYFTCHMRLCTNQFMPRRRLWLYVLIKKHSELSKRWFISELVFALGALVPHIKHGSTFSYFWNTFSNAEIYDSALLKFTLHFLYASEKRQSSFFYLRSLFSQIVSHDDTSSTKTYRIVFNFTKRLHFSERSSITCAF